MTLQEIIELQNKLSMLAAQIGEHCNAVQILCSVPADGGGTSAIKVGCGDWYARRGLAMEFIEADQAQTSAEAIGREINPQQDE